MDSAAALGAGWVGLVGALFVLVLLIAWVLLPFAMFGMKPLLRELIAETKRTNTLLERLAPAPSKVGEKSFFTAG